MVWGRTWLESPPASDPARFGGGEGARGGPPRPPRCRRIPPDRMTTEWRGGAPAPVSARLSSPRSSANHAWGGRGTGPLGCDAFVTLACAARGRRSDTNVTLART
eukprot:895361-Prorocentrum_minimum.AAC.1